MSDIAQGGDGIRALLSALIVIQLVGVGVQLGWLFIRTGVRQRHELAVAGFWNTQVPRLLQCLDDRSGRKRWVTETRRRRLGIARGALLEFVVGTSGSYRTHLLSVYGELGLLGRDVRSLRSPLWVERIRALRRLTLVATPTERLPVLAVKDDSWAARVLIAQILARIGTADDVRETLMGWHVSSRLHECAFRTVLEAMPLAEFQDILSTWERFPDPALRRELLTVGALRAPALAARLLPTAATDTSEEVRVGACRAASRFVAESSVSLLSGLCVDTRWAVRAQAAKALGVLRDPRALSVLVLALSDSSFWVRQNAARALVKHGEAGCTLLTATATRDSDRFAREAARSELHSAYIEVRTESVLS